MLPFTLFTNLKLDRAGLSTVIPFGSNCFQFGTENETWHIDQQRSQPKGLVRLERVQSLEDNTCQKQRARQIAPPFFANWADIQPGYGSTKLLAPSTQYWSLWKLEILENIIIGMCHLLKTSLLERALCWKNWYLGMSSTSRLPHAQYTHPLEIFLEQLIKKSAEILSRKQAQSWQDRSWPSWACWSLMPDYEATQKGHLLETYKVDPIYPLKGPRLSESAEKQPISSFKSRRVYFADTSRRLEIAGLSLGGRVWRRITVIAGGDKDGTVGIRFCVSQSGYVGVNRLWEFECWLQLSWRQRHTPNSHLHELSWGLLTCEQYWFLQIHSHPVALFFSLLHSLCYSTQIHINRSQGEGRKICKTTLIQTT